MEKVNIPNELFKQLKTQSDVEHLVGDIYKQLIEKMLDAEMDNHLGYQKNDRQKKKTTNSRNGHNSKQLNTAQGKIEIAVPRDRAGEFEPVIVAKHERTSAKIEQVVISLYAKGLSVKDIEEQIRDIYGVELSPAKISHITSQVLEHLHEWKNRPLDSTYLICWIDGIVFKVRHEGKIINKTVYVVIGLSNTGQKEILGLWIHPTESASFWMSVFSDLQQRGVEDILIMCSDNLKGLTEGIAAIYPNTVSQICIVHQIRNSMKFVAWKERKKFAADLKLVYKAINREQAELALQQFSEKWQEKYPYAVKSWQDNWTNLSAFFEFPEAIRKLIYTTNVIESFNSMVRRDTSKKTIFTNDDAALKAIFLAVQRIEKKWTLTVRNWGPILNQFLIIFEDRCKIKM
jgi:transposase-like protein